MERVNENTKQQNAKKQYKEYKPEPEQLCMNKRPTITDALRQGGVLRPTLLNLVPDIVMIERKEETKI